MSKLLFFKDHLVGVITASAVEDVAWLAGDIDISVVGHQIRGFLQSLTDEGSDSGRMGGSSVDLMSVENWSIQDQATGRRRAIELPAVYFDDNGIYWRWRVD